MDIGFEPELCPRLHWELEELTALSQTPGWWGEGSLSLPKNPTRLGSFEPQASTLQASLCCPPKYPESKSLKVGDPVSPSMDYHELPSGSTDVV